MARAATLLTVIALAQGLPDSCARALGRRTDVDPSAQPPMAGAPALPVASATAPPVWAPPDTSPPATATPPNPDLARARAFAQTGDSKKVRALLEKKVRAGKASKEEAMLLVDACIALRDKACLEAAKAKHPEIDGI